jgi:hypothetical protein
LFVTLCISLPIYLPCCVTHLISFYLWHNMYDIIINFSISLKTKFYILWHITSPDFVLSLWCVVSNFCFHAKRPRHLRLCWLNNLHFIISQQT